ncbi:MAG: SPW repeat protein [Candidatus Gastranaerophilales bacterium]|nr:SPW repeat protein [Candidatus Gastranaerophilales bacterium]
MAVWFIWGNFFVGIWLILSSFAIDAERTIVISNNVIAGILVVVFAILTRRLLSKSNDKY